MSPSLLLLLILKKCSSSINIASCFVSLMMQVVVESVEDFLETFECVGSFSQDKKEPNSIVVPGCPPLLDWRKMEAEEGEITLVSVLDQCTTPLLPQ